MSVRRIDQGMAVAAAGLLPSPVTREMRTRYRQLRQMLQSAGLAATYAFIAAKSGEAGELAVAYRRVGEGLRQQLLGIGLLPADRELTAAGVLQRLGEMSPVEYARASAEAQALASWLSRLADAMHKPAGQDDAGRPAAAAVGSGARAGA